MRVCRLPVAMSTGLLATETEALLVTTAGARSLKLPARGVSACAA